MLKTERGDRIEVRRFENGHPEYGTNFEIVHSIPAHCFMEDAQIRADLRKKPEKRKPPTAVSVFCDNSSQVVRYVKGAIERAG